MPCARAPRAANRIANVSRKRRIFCPSLRCLEPAHWVKAAAWPGSKEVSDGEFKQVRVIDGPPREREPDFEPERPQGREPAQAETGAHEEPERKGAAALGALEEVLLLRVHVSC